MKLLICKWDAMTYPFIIKTFSEMGYDQVILPYPIEQMYRQETRTTFMEVLAKEIDHEDFTAVFSVNFISAIAEVCNDKQILYICWSYDCPSVGEEPRTHFFDTNRIFVFDSAECDFVKRSGVNNIWHVDLAVDCGAMKSVRKLSPKEMLRYQSEISFVGQLYSTEFNNLLPYLSEYSAGLINAVKNIQLLFYGRNIIKEVVNKEFIQFINTPEFEQAIQPYAEKIHVYSGKLQPDVLRTFLLQTVANKERVMLLSMLSKYYQTSLYSKDTNKEYLEKVSFRGMVDYWKEMPLVFSNSKVNLNSTLRTIEKGIPQRCLDVMACRGLLMTNEQADMNGKLKDGENVVIYHSVGEAVEKAGYYLKHEDVANKIRMNGYSTVKHDFSFRAKLEQIMKLAGVE